MTKIESKAIGFIKRYILLFLLGAITILALSLIHISEPTRRS